MPAGSASDREAGREPARIRSRPATQLARLRTHGDRWGDASGPGLKTPVLRLDSRYCYREEITTGFSLSLTNNLCCRSASRWALSRILLPPSLARSRRNRENVLIGAMSITILIERGKSRTPCGLAARYARWWCQTGILLCLARRRAARRGAIRLAPPGIGPTRLTSPRLGSRR